jgi:hypothetical protein
MVAVNASLRGKKRGVAMPLFLDLARKPHLLHDNSVSSLDELMSPSRGTKAPHPFYLPDTAMGPRWSPICGASIRTRIDPIPWAANVPP